MGLNRLWAGGPLRDGGSLRDGERAAFSLLLGVVALAGGRRRRKTLKGEQMYWNRAELSKYLSV